MPWQQQLVPALLKAEPQCRVGPGWHWSSPGCSGGAPEPTGAKPASTSAKSVIAHYLNMQTTGVVVAFQKTFCNCNCVFHIKQPDAWGERERRAINL